MIADAIPRVCEVPTVMDERRAASDRMPCSDSAENKA